VAVAKTSHPLVKRGATSVSGQSISASSNYTLSIALGRSDFNLGFALVTVPNSVSGVLQRRTTAHLWFTDVLSQAVSQASLRTLVSTTSYNGIQYLIPDNKHASYFYDADSLLSGAHFDAADEANAKIQITSAQINGSNLEIVFRNIHGAQSATLTVDVEWNVRAVKVVA